MTTPQVPIREYCITFYKFKELVDWIQTRYGVNVNDCLGRTKLMQDQLARKKALHLERQQALEFEYDKTISELVSDWGTDDPRWGPPTSIDDILQDGEISAWEMGRTDFQEWVRVLMHIPMDPGRISSIDWAVVRVKATQYDEDAKSTWRTTMTDIFIQEVGLGPHNYQF